MTDTSNIIVKTARFIGRHSKLILPVAVAAMIFGILAPMSPLMMDILLAGSITLSAVVLLTAIYVSSPMEFNVFPSVLLGATLFRLVLNVASTRLILTAGADGASPEDCALAAGEVIWSFSRFVTAGSLAVGVIIFVIIMVIQLIVVTKGAARISEVTARFVLDSMPGRQMAIDADLNAGLIDQQQALAQRARIAGESDFYGAMDGASKFLRGDAMAAILITMVNIVGGLYIGIVQYGWNFSETVGLFTKLTIGDGLVTQIPALLVSVAAALLVTRPAAKADLADQVVKQITAKPAALGITAAFLAALTLTSLPKLPLLLMGVGCGGLAWILSGKRREQASPEEPSPTTTALEAKPSAKADELRKALAVDAMSIELGYALVTLTDASTGAGLLERISAVRLQLAETLGVVVPPIRISDNMRLDPREYAIKIRGTKVGGGRLYPNELLAISRQSQLGEVVGRQTVDPANGVPAVWITQERRDQAEMMGYVVTHPTAVLAAHGGEVVGSHAASLLTRRQTTAMLTELKLTAADLVAEAGEKIRIGHLQKVLQNLLRERVSIRDMESVLEAVCDAAEKTSDVAAITEQVRASMAESLSRQYCSEDGRLWCVSLAPTLENALAACYQSDKSVGAITAAPELAERVTQAVREGVNALASQGKRAVIVCAPQARPIVREMIAQTIPQAAVLGYNEIESVDVRPVVTVGTQK